MGLVRQVLTTISILLAIFPPIFSVPILDPDDFDALDEPYLKHINTGQYNPEELGEYIKDDIRRTVRLAGSDLSADEYRWPNGVVPYVIAGKFSRSQRRAIKWAMNEFRKRSCINFRPRSTEEDYVSIENEEPGCFAHLGKANGKRVVNLESPCFRTHKYVLHEFMHTLGFDHEHNRHDRDEYVQIHLENIEPGIYINFEKNLEPDGLELPYDYTSLMHYSAYMFSINGEPTIVPKKNTTEAKLMGLSKTLTELDLAKLNKAYQCPDKDS